MKGLLYKDFLAIKGKWLSIALVIFVVVYVGLRITLPGERWKYADILLYFLYSVVSAVLVVLPTMSLNYIFGQDEKSKSKKYMLSLPFAKKDFVASKYVLFLVVYYVLLSVIYILSMAFMIGATDQQMIENVQQENIVRMGLMLVFLLFHSVQFPAYLLLGVKKAGEVNTTIIMLIMLALLPVFLFVNPDNLDLSAFMMKHKNIIVAVITNGFWLVLGIYYLSYRFTLKHFKVGEVSEYE